MRPPSLRSRTVFVGVFFSSSPNFEMILSLSPWNFCGQWHCSHVARAGRSVCTGDGIGREYVPNVTAMTWRTPSTFALTTQGAPGPMWQLAQAMRECGESR